MYGGPYNMQFFVTGFSHLALFKVEPHFSGSQGFVSFGCRILPRPMDRPHCMETFTG